jgi:hypothetical protein
VEILINQQEKDMNRDNIQSTIDVLKMAQNFNINDFQDAADPDAMTQYVSTVEELHVCGNTACIAGYVGLTQSWRDFGGTVIHGVPSFSKDGKRVDPEQSLALYWGIDKRTADGIIYGGDNFWKIVWDHDIKGMPDEWKQMTKDQAVSLFEQLLALDAAGVKL